MTINNTRLMAQRSLFSILYYLFPVAFLLIGCNPSVQYNSDPFKSLNITSVANQQSSKPKLGIIFSENALKAIQLIEETHSYASLGGLNITFDYREIDANYLIGRLNEVFAQRFSSVSNLQNLNSVDRSATDIVIALDLQVKFGQMTTSLTTVKISGIFLGTSGQEIEKVNGEGSGMVPWPTYTYNFRAAVDQAIESLARSLDRSSVIAQFVNNSPDLRTISSTKATQPSSPPPMEQVKKVAPVPKDQNQPSQNEWAVVIGISRYEFAKKDGLNDLIFADDDALAFADALIRLGWQKSHIRLLIDEEATQRNVVVALESWLTKVRPGDKIVLFWAGHGFTDPEDPEKVYFACFDTDISIPATGYRMDRVRTALEERNARNVLVFADTCHAGKLITRGTRGISIVPNINKMIHDQSIPKGWVFMVAADTDRQAVEHSSWINGAFTHCLLKGLQSYADGFQSAGDKDGKVTMGELKDYMNAVMPDETQKILGVAKHPVITTSTGDPDIWNITLQPSR